MTIITGISTTGLCTRKGFTPQTGANSRMGLLHFQLAAPAIHVPGASHAFVVLPQAEDCKNKPGGNAGARADAKVTRFMVGRNPAAPPPAVYCQWYAFRVDISY